LITNQPKRNPKQTKEKERKMETLPLIVISLGVAFLILISRPFVKQLWAKVKERRLRRKALCDYFLFMREMGDLAAKLREIQPLQVEAPLKLLSNFFSAISPVVVKIEQKEKIISLLPAFEAERLTRVIIVIREMGSSFNGFRVNDWGAVIKRGKASEEDIIWNDKPISYWLRSEAASQYRRLNECARHFVNDTINKLFSALYC